MKNTELIEKLYGGGSLTLDEYTCLIAEHDESDCELLYQYADEVRNRWYGHDVYLRGLVEFSSCCKNDCYYCGLRKSNKKAKRYRLTKEQILECCHEGYELGYRTFVLQSGEDDFYTDEKICDIVSSIKREIDGCAITLSIGEKSYESYKAYFDAGADRYLLRHETADFEHYSKLHPPSLSAKRRQQCLYDLMDIGYQVGTGFMVGSPFQTAWNLAQDMIFLRTLKPHMVGIGPFIAHSDTPFASFDSGTTELTVFMIALIRLTLPKANIPATTALATIDPRGREKGICAGANVCMPNLSPLDIRKKYMLYDEKVCTGDESAQCRACLQRRLESVGFKPVVSIGDCACWNESNA
ncbi:MAG: [FeFe] hydrogenase H-cluster radical SAM maturase HydE [Ruminococcus sp.]|nr:[FeFe] hydrogenase H-cluster radical SAM maturase HydE [Ruminococcus sp.]